MGEILVKVVDGIAWVTLSNPGKRNALDLAMWHRLAAVFSELGANDALRCIIVRGADSHFAGGADIEEFPTVRANAEQGRRYHTEAVGSALDAIAHCMHPTIAAIEGACAGGGLEIACACDLRIASPDARLGIPIKRLGFPLAPHEMQSLLALVGPPVALELLLEGRMLDAAEAMEKGLLHRIAADVHAEAQATAMRIAAGAPLAARANKALIRRLTPPAKPLTEDEMRAAFVCLDSADYRAGLQAFLEKRPPRFSGR